MVHWASPKSTPANWPLKTSFVIFFSKSQPGRSKEGFYIPPMSPFPPSSVGRQCAEAGPFPSRLCLHAFGLGADLAWPVLDMLEHPVLGGLFI